MAKTCWTTYSCPRRARDVQDRISGVCSLKPVRHSLGSLAVPHAVLPFCSHKWGPLIRAYRPSDQYWGHDLPSSASSASRQSPVVGGAAARESVLAHWFGIRALGSAAATHLPFQMWRSTCIHRAPGLCRWQAGRRLRPLDRGRERSAVIRRSSICASRYWGLLIWGRYRKSGGLPFRNILASQSICSCHSLACSRWLELGFRNGPGCQAFDDGSLTIYSCSQCRLRHSSSLVACGMNGVLASWQHLFSVPPLGSRWNLAALYPINSKVPPQSEGGVHAHHSPSHYH